MPMIQVKIAAPRTAADVKPRVAAAVAELSSRILRKNPAITAVVVESVATDDWYCGGRSLAAEGKAAFWLDIRVTEGSNSKDEMAAFIAAVYARMGELLGPLHEESYVHVVAVQAHSYGYGGRTQERRYIAAQLAEEVV